MAQTFVFGKVGIEDLEQGYGPFSASTRLPDGSVATLNKIGIQSFLGSSYLSASDFTGANAGAKISAAIAALPSTGGVVDARGLVGAQTWSTVTINKDVVLLLGAATLAVTGNAFTHSSGELIVIGLGVGTTVIACSGSGVWNFNPAYQTYGIGFSNLSITCASTATNAVVIGTATLGLCAWTSISNVRIYGPGHASGTAKGVVVNGMRNSNWENIWIDLFPGDGLWINGDMGAEDHFTRVFIDSVGGHLIYVSRATTTQLGGYYFMDCVVSNQSVVTTCKGVYVMCASGSPAELNFNYINGGVDVIMGGDSFHFENTGHILISGVQVQNAAPAGTNPSLDAGVNCFSAIYLKNVNDVEVSACNLVSNSRCVAFWGSNNFYKFAGNRYTGDGTNTVGIFIEQAASQKGLIDFDPLTILKGATTDLAMLTNDYGSLEAIRTAYQTGWPEVFGQNVSGTWRLSSYAGSTVSGATPHKHWRVESGNLRLYNSALTTIITSITDTGALVAAESLASPLVTIGVATARTGDLYVGNNTQAIMVYDTASATADIASSLRMYRSRSTIGARTGATGNVVNGDRLGGMAAYAWSAGFMATAELLFEVEGAVVSGQRPGSKFTLVTNIPNGAQTRHASLSGAGLWSATAFGIEGGAAGGTASVTTASLVGKTMVFTNGLFISCA